ncbi:hypothetical protein KKI24_28220, partial [bacterium]|nr:hypothetical protein [bacterium]
GLYEKHSPQRHGDHEGKQAELSDCHRAVLIAWSSFLDDLDEAKRPRPRLSERSEFWSEKRNLQLRRAKQVLDHLEISLPTERGLYQSRVNTEISFSFFVVP